ncbi:MAG: hypothetical protein ACW98A_15975 [Candidatus Hodarchaeales archaeon]|jgi:hypothetical membrane protein
MNNYIVKMDQFYDRFNGAYFGILSIIISLVSVFIAVISYVNIGNTFSFQDTFLSTLGDTPGLTTLIYSGGVVLVNFSKLFFALYLYLIYFRSKNVSKRVSWILFGISIITTTGFLVHLVPFSVSPALHIGGTMVYFLTSVLGFVLVSILELRNMELSNYLAIFGIIVVIFYFSFAFFLFELETGNFQNRAIAVTVEWLSYFSVLTWVFVHSAYMLKNP